MTKVIFIHFDIITIVTLYNNFWIIVCLSLLCVYSIGFLNNYLTLSYLIIITEELILVTCFLFFKIKIAVIQRLWPCREWGKHWFYFSFFFFIFINCFCFNQLIHYFFHSLVLCLYTFNQNCQVLPFVFHRHKTFSHLLCFRLPCKLHFFFAPALK